MKILHVVGARPNFMKVAPVINALARYPEFEQYLVHTGQHYNTNMSEIFFDELGIPKPDVNLEVGSGSHTYQTAHIMLRLEDTLKEQKPELVLVYGDVNSTVAAALVCAKMRVPLGHVEAGLRSRDLSMPEEINRMVTDRIANYLFTPSRDANENLLAEGCDAERIVFVGNVMIDTLVRLLPKAQAPVGLPQRYALVTLHRPSNVDEKHVLLGLVDALVRISDMIPIVFPMHPRTRKRLEEFGIVVPDRERLNLIEPVGYLQFLALQKSAAFVITDSGGVQEETTYLGVPCLTMRTSTERPITVDIGTNIVIGQDLERLVQEVKKILAVNGKRGELPELWDGRTGERIAQWLYDTLCQ